MRIKFLLLMVLSLSLSCFSNLEPYLIDVETEVPFVKVVIGCFDEEHQPNHPWTSGNLDPIDGDIYIPYSTMDGYQSLVNGGYTIDDEPVSDTTMNWNVYMDVTGRENCYFVAEFYDERGGLAGYTDTFTQSQVLEGWDSWDNPVAFPAWVIGKTHSVPEPTSGLLLLMGGALLALRRKRQRV